MYKILSILLLVVISSTAIAQERGEKHFTPKPLQVPGGDRNSSFTINPNKVEIGKLTEFLTTIGNIVQQLPPDNMPCVVPNTSNITAIPNAFSPSRDLPYMPNSMPLRKKSPSR